MAGLVISRFSTGGILDPEPVVDGEAVGLLTCCISLPATHQPINPDHVMFANLLDAQATERHRCDEAPLESRQ